MRKITAFACMMYATLSVSAQFVEVTTIDVQTETNKIKVVEKEKPIDKTIRPKGFLGIVGYEMEVFPILVRSDNFPEVRNAELLHGPKIELGYQITPQFGVTVEGVCGFGKAYDIDNIDSEYNSTYTLHGLKYGGLVNTYYYFSPRLADGFYISAGIGYIQGYASDFVFYADHYADLDYVKLKRYEVDIPEEWITLEIKAGYAWKNMKVESFFELMKFEYEYEYEKDYYGKQIYPREIYDNIHTQKLEVVCGLKVSYYFNTGYLKFRK